MVELGMGGHAQGITTGGYVIVGHVDFPEIQFKVTFSGAGVPVGFAVEPRPYGLTKRDMLERLSGKAPVPEGPPVTARLLRRLPIGQIQDFARAQLVAEGPGFIGRNARSWAAAFDVVARPGRAGRDDRAYAAIAARYVARGHNVHAVADELGYSPSQIRNMLYEARCRGLLTPAPRGRSGGQLTDTAREILNGQH